jgi:hypothetical protein
VSKPGSDGRQPRGSTFDLTEAGTEARIVMLDVAVFEAPHRSGRWLNAHPEDGEVIVVPSARGANARPVP